MHVGDILPAREAKNKYFFNRAFNSLEVNFPRFQWEEDDEGLLCYVPVPGYDKESLEVNVENEYVNINGRSSTFSIDVSLLIPAKVYADNIYCELENGLLTIHFPMRNASSSRSLL